MNYQFSSAVSNLKPSFIREMLKLTANENIISFAGGLPDSSLFPKEDIKVATESVFHQQSAAIFQYAPTEGHDGLRQWIAAHFEKTQGVNIPLEQIMIVSGSQQALDLVGKIFISPKDTVVVENPSYLGAIQAFKMYQPEFCEVALQMDGVDINGLQAALADPNCKFFYGIPNFQNPTGLSYSIQKRSQVAKVLQDTQKLMVEDDPYGSLTFATDPKAQRYSRSIYALAPDHVIYMGSFSKIFVPGFRVGWIIAPKPIIQKMVTAKQAADLHTNSFVQSVLYEYLTQYDLYAHIETIRTSYARKKACMAAALHTHLGDKVEIYPSDGGMFLWVKIAGINAMQLFDYGVKHNVAVVPGEAFSLSQDFKDHIRLNFTGLNLEQIEQGVRNLKQALDEYHTKAR